MFPLKVEKCTKLDIMTVLDQHFDGFINLHILELVLDYTFNELICVAIYMTIDII